MANINVPFPKLAEIALSIMAGAQVPASDEALAMAQGTRQFLRQIAQGQLVVSAAPTDVGQTPTELAPQQPHNVVHSDGVMPAPKPKRGNGMKGADGVVSESITGARRP